MSERFDNKLILELKVSYVLVGILLAMHGGAMVIVGVVPLSWWWRLALGGAVVLSLYLALRAHGLPLAGAVTAVELDRDGSWALRFAGDATWHSCRLIDRWVQPRVVVLRLRRDGRRRAHNVVIFADAVAAEPFRRLRARLRLEAVAA